MRGLLIHDINKIRVMKCKLSYFFVSHIMQSFFRSHRSFYKLTFFQNDEHDDDGSFTMLEERENLYVNLRVYMRKMIDKYKRGNRSPSVHYEVSIVTFRATKLNSNITK